MARFLIENWQLQSLIADAVLYQRQSADAIRDTAKIVQIVNLAAQLSCSANEINQAAFEQAQQLFGISRFLLEEIIADNRKLVQQTAESYGINISVSEKGLVNHTSATQRNALQKFLGEQVKEIALTAISHQQLQNATNLSRLVSHIQRDINLLFGLQSSAVFIYQDANHCLQGLTNEQEHSAIWSSITISLNPGISLLAKALAQDELMFSSVNANNELEPIVDRQLRRLLGCEQLLAIPLNIAEMPVGVIVAGIHEHQNVHVKNQSAFIKLFASEVGQALQQTQQAEYTAQQQIEQLQASYRLHAQKMVHEINNPLSIINNYLYLLGLKLGNHADNEIKLIQDEINRVGQLLLSLPDLPGQPLSENSYAIDINALIKDITHLFSMGVLQTQTVELTLQLDKTEPKFTGSRNKLKQVLINLIKNAAEAMPNGGVISLSTKSAVFLGKKSYSQIIIADNGPGLPDTIKEQLYKPVKSSKGEQHKGLGLVISKSLIDEMNGNMILTSSKDTGTTIQILLP
ncbi:ATP-binding protein [Methylocucumis oryzae]|uniref:ATP-binding protein n=1 Tax=Methylocucumis oryzae TaxID=1632867 RepID=UPI00178CE485|nr:ATP-binding protein [Methylocucumis oryzae]